jgi:DNA adenine methylase
MTYPGGKNGSGVYQHIINEMPPHRVYVEPFLGHGAIMKLKKPAPASIGIDTDGDVIAHWRSLGSAPPNLTLLQANALDWLASTDFSNDTLIYCDPPYLMSTRSSQRQIYRCELKDKDHKRLLEIIKGLPCMVMVSGYWSEMYALALHDWRTDTFTTRTRGGKVATEWLWMNFPEPLELQDYSFLGDNFRERERIQRKIRRWKSRLLKMTPLERHAIMAAISEIRQR